MTERDGLKESGTSGLFLFQFGFGGGPDFDDSHSADRFWPAAPAVFPDHNQRRNSGPDTDRDLPDAVVAG